VPTLVFVAGPNGSGKSTVASQAFLARLFQTPEDPPPVRINPDDIQRALAKQHPDKPKTELEVMAAVRADEMIGEALAMRSSIIRETVLSTDRLEASVMKARASGYRFALLFVVLKHPDLNVARVKARIAQGGHDVPEDKIRARWTRAMGMLPRFSRHADVLLIYDNSAIADPRTPGFGPRLLIDASPEGLYVSETAQALLEPGAQCAPEVKQALEAVIAMAAKG
jgi:predicted ABC-type ATPase